MSPNTPEALDKIEQLHNDGHTSQEIVEALGGFDPWQVQGATGFHDGIDYGVAGTAWTRADARRWNQGWAAAAKHAGLRKVVLADCGKDDRNCTACNSEQGDWHIMGCSKLEATERTPGILAVGRKFWFTDPVVGETMAEVLTSPNADGYQDWRWLWGEKWVRVVAPAWYLTRLEAGVKS